MGQGADFHLPCLSHERVEGCRAPAAPVAWRTPLMRAPPQHAPSWRRRSGWRHQRTVRSTR
jgi:hypothetical protein